MIPLPVTWKILENEGVQYGDPYMKCTDDKHTNNLQQFTKEELLGMVLLKRGNKNTHKWYRDACLY